MRFHVNILSSSLIRVYFLVRSQKRATTKGSSGALTLVCPHTKTLPPIDGIWYSLLFGIQRLQEINVGRVALSV